MNAAETLAGYQHLAEQATPGPWTPTCMVNGMASNTITAGRSFGSPHIANVRDEHVGAFIAASRTLGPAMADALQEILGYHSPATLWEETGRGPEYYERCSRCVYTTTYPCPTVAIITKHLEGK